MAIQMRRGLSVNFDPTKLLAGEWAVTVDADTGNQIVYMCFGGGIVKRMGTYEDFAVQVDQAITEKTAEIVAEVTAIKDSAETYLNETKEYVDIATSTIVNTYLPQIEEYCTRAELASANAESFSASAEIAKNGAEGSATLAETNAMLSKSYAVGGTDTRPNEDTDNAKYYYEQAKAVVGGDFIPNSDRGIPDGVATLGVDGKVPTKQLPPISSDAKDITYKGSNVETALDNSETHIGTTVVSESGVHDIRYNTTEEVLQVKVDNEWVDCGGGAPVLTANIVVTTPDDELIGAEVVLSKDSVEIARSTFGTTKTVYFTRIKELGTYTVTCGELSTTVNVSDYITYEATIGVPPQSFRKMTAIIDLSNSNPETCVTYADDAVGMTAGSSDWDDFFGHYPVLLKNGVEVGKLQRNDFDKFEDGSTADISSGDAGDAMIAFPRRGLTIKTVDNKIYISMTDDTDNADFEYNAHTRETTAKDVFYLGVYKGYVTNGNLRSLKGKTITASQTIATFRTQAQANGSGYEQSGFYQVTFRQVMFILKYKTLNSQSAVGRGYTANKSAIATGGTEAKGMDWGETTGNQHMKLFGLEDFWGNIWEWMDGCVTDSTRNILTANSGFNDSGSGYTNNGNGGVSTNIVNYMSKPQGSTKAGFIAKEVSGSESTYFTDYGHLYGSSVATFGGRWSDVSLAGAFMHGVASTASYSGADVGGRLMYL